MTTATAVPPCPSCGADRVNVARQPGATPLYECPGCGEIESPLVGIVPAEPSDEPPPDEPVDEQPEPPAEDDEVLPPAPDDSADDPPPPDDGDPAPAGDTGVPGLNPSGPNGGDIGQLHALVEILPADFPLPALIRFTPDTRIRAAADEDAAKLNAIAVTDETSMRVVDACLERQRAHQATIEALFAEPCAVANQLHKHLTGLRADWLQASRLAIGAANDRVLAQKRTLEREAAEARRRAQEEADRRAKEDRQREAEAAKQAQAPASVVQQLEFEAQTATAPPIQQTSVAAPALRSSSVVPKWRGRLASTDRAAENLQPGMGDLTPAQLEDVKTAMRAVLESRAPITIFEINYSVIDRRAGADKKTFAIPGFVAEDIGGIRAKPGRRKA